MAAGANRVVVVGGGLAGMAAARELGERGHEAIVLEAQRRPGGRVSTLREPFADGLYAEAGATYVRDTDNFTLEYLRLCGLATVPEPDPLEQAAIHFVRGRRFAPLPTPLEWPEGLLPEERRLGVLGMLRRYVLPALPALGDPRASDWPPPSLERQDRQSFGELLRGRGASDAAVALLRLSNHDFVGDGVESVSALSSLRVFAMPYRALMRIEGGSDRLPLELASRLGERIRYGTTVKRIEHDESGARVFVDEQGVVSELAASGVVCALPFSVLRQIEIAPALSPVKQQVVSELLYTSVTRLFFQTRRRFWLERRERGAAETDLPIQSVWDETATQAGERGILSSYSTGPRARKWAALAESARIESALGSLERVHPGFRAEFERGASKCWDDDPWARGAYCFFKPGQLTRLGPALRIPDGRIHFAGDHTSSWPGWMQGALESGVRAAEEIARRTLR